VSCSHPRALDASVAIAERLIDPNLVHVPVDTVNGGRSRPQSLAGGAAGIALLHTERARAGHGDWATAHAWLAAAAREDLSAGPNAGLFFGAPTLAFVTRAALDRPQKLTRALAQLDTSTTAMTRKRLATAHARIDRAERPALAEFDLIRGLTGLGTYHLHRDPHDPITAAVLSYLVRLTEPLPGRTDGLPGWWTDLAPNGSPSRDFPGGHGNFGMSHGISAPLALLSLAMRCGVVVAGHTDAIDRICAWTDLWRQDHVGGPWWPGYITEKQVQEGHAGQAHRQRPSWCYGTPGVARAQQLAGLATADTARQRAAESAILGCLRDPGQLGRITDSGLCHGLAGVFHTAWRMAADTYSPDLVAELPSLTDTLLGQLACSPQDPEFLDGRAGIALALHTAGTNTAPRTQWDACLLLA
jgi:hypothetical protein